MLSCFYYWVVVKFKEIDSSTVLEKCRGGIARIKLVQGLAEKQLALVGASVGSTGKII